MHYLPYLFNVQGANFSFKAKRNIKSIVAARVAQKRKAAAAFDTIFQFFDLSVPLDDKHEIIVWPLKDG